MAAATVFVPGSIGNVGPGFDVLGLAVGGLGDRVTVELVDGPSQIAEVTGRDAAAVPREPEGNCAAVAALSVLHRLNISKGVSIQIDRSLPLAGGLGASAAASVGGALAAFHAAGKKMATREDEQLVLAAALEGEASVAGRHLDNIAPSLFGGLTLVRSVDPIDVVRVPIRGHWWLVVVSPAMRLATKKARGVLPQVVPQIDFVTQMANTAGLLLAFTTGDHALASRSLIDIYAEPRRAALIQGFRAVQRAAKDSGALGSSISGAGPSVFALCSDEATAKGVGEAMQAAFQPLTSTCHIGKVAERGAMAI